MEPQIKYPSPSDKYHFKIDAWEARMSLWIESPALVNVSSGETVLTFKESNWSLDVAEWKDEEHVTMELRRYPGDHSPSQFVVEVDCLAKKATIGDDSMELNSLEKYLEALYRRSRVRLGSPTPSSSGCLVGLLLAFLKL